MGEDGYYAYTVGFGGGGTRLGVREEGRLGMEGWMEKRGGVGGSDRGWCGGSGAVPGARLIPRFVIARSGPCR